MLARRDLGESDRLVVLLGKQMGKFSARAPGARRSRRRFGGRLELFSRIEVMAVLKGRTGLAHLDDAVLLDAHQGIRGDLIATAQAAYLTELVSCLLREADRSPEVFDLLADALQRLDRERLGVWSLRRFEIELLKLIGFAPAFDVCQECGVRSSERWSLQAGMGGLLCEACAPRSGSVSAAAVNVLRRIQADEPCERVDDATMAEVRGLLAAMVDGLVDRPLKARDFLYRLACEQDRSWAR
ncbi:MAG: DNA repair protein RecO [Deltaproteobacteria bacterium]|nr:DNA repair protein RecO [Deltaproteobacteria bacterium]